MTIKRRTNVPKTEATDHQHSEDTKGGRHPMLHGQHQTVYQFIVENPYCTREDAARATGIKSSTVTARIKELIDEGFLIEPPGMRKANRSGVSAKCLHVTHRATGGKPLDKVRVEIVLTIDCNGIFGAEARVVGGSVQTGRPHALKKTRITLTAPHPDTYRSAFDTSEVSTVSRHELASHADDIIDVDYVEVVDN